MSICGSCDLYHHDICEADCLASDECLKKLHDYIDELKSELDKCGKAKEPIAGITDEDVKLGGLMWRAGVSTYRCPQCDALIRYKDNHCSVCGQKMDWKEAQ